MSRLVIGNWKMHGNLAENRRLVTAMIEDARINRAGVALASPHIYLLQLAGLLQHTHIDLAAQDISRFCADGAYTGEISATMLFNVGCLYVLIGHSERRQYLEETDAVLVKKIANALEAGLRPVLCVGESLAQREAGTHLSAIGAQLNVLKGFSLHDVIVAYEPIWAIGTGKVATLEQIREMHDHIQAVCALQGRQDLPVLYGGSVKASNAPDIFSIDSVGGVLVGGASLDAESFGQICDAARMAPSLPVSACEKRHLAHPARISAQQ